MTGESDADGVNMMTKKTSERPNASAMPGRDRCNLESRARFDRSRVIIRPAKESDVRAVVSAHTAAFPRFFLSYLGPSFLRLLYEELANPLRAILIVADREGAVVGFVGGTLDESAFFAHLREERLHDFALAALGAAVRRPQIIPRLMRARSQGSSEANVIPATLLTLGVTPDARGLGLGRRLFNAFRDQTFQAGVAAFVLTTDAVHNEPTLQFYESVGGMRVRETFQTPEGRLMHRLVYRR